MRLWTREFSFLNSRECCWWWWGSRRAQPPGLCPAGSRSDSLPAIDSSCLSENPPWKGKLYLSPPVQSLQSVRNRWLCSSWRKHQHDFEAVILRGKKLHNVALTCSAFLCFFRFSVMCDKRSDLWFPTYSLPHFKTSISSPRCIIINKLLVVIFG